LRRVSLPHVCAKPSAPPEQCFLHFAGGHRAPKGQVVGHQLVSAANTISPFLSIISLLFFVCVFFFLFVCFIHMCIQCLGHFSPLPPPPPLPPTPPSSPFWWPSLEFLSCSGPRVPLLERAGKDRRSLWLWPGPALTAKSAWVCCAPVWFVIGCWRGRGQPTRLHTLCHAP
jgi:quinol-cytochrome oxidoreductase complex cytochrome b subunit